MTDETELPTTDETELLETEPAPGAGGPTLSLGAAVRATGVARSTLQRRLTAGAIAGATRTEAGGWSIPIGGLIGAGLVPTVTPPETPPGPTSGPPVETVADEVADLRAEVDRLRADRDRAEALAAERGRHVDDLRVALEALARALPAGPVAAPLEDQGTPPPAAPPARRWWHRS